MEGEAVDEKPEDATTQTRALMEFIRENDLVAAVDRGVWLFSGGAEELIEAYLVEQKWCKAPTV